MCGRARRKDMPNWVEPFRPFVVSTRPPGLASNRYSAHAQFPRCTRHFHPPTYVQTQPGLCCAFREKDCRKSLLAPATSNRVWFPPSTPFDFSSRSGTAGFSPSRSRTPHLRSRSPDNESTEALDPRGNLLLHCGRSQYSPRSSSATRLEGGSQFSRESLKGNAFLHYRENLIAQSLWLPCPTYSDKHHSSHFLLGAPFPPWQGRRTWCPFFAWHRPRPARGAERSLATTPFAQSLSAAFLPVPVSALFPLVFVFQGLRNLLQRLL
jgi:hypothetical protein